MVAQACEVRRVAVQTVVASRVSVYPSVPVSQPASATASSARVRPLIGLGTSSAALQTSGPVPLEAQADEAAKQVKLHWMPSSTSSLSMSSTLRVGYRSIDQASLNDPPCNANKSETPYCTELLGCLRLGWGSSFRRWLGTRDSTS